MDIQGLTNGRHTLEHWWILVYGIILVSVNELYSTDPRLTELVKMLPVDRCNGFGFSGNSLLHTSRLWWSLLWEWTSWVTCILLLLDPSNLVLLAYLFLLLSRCCTPTPFLTWLLLWLLYLFMVVCFNRRLKILCRHSLLALLFWNLPSRVIVLWLFINFYRPSPMWWAFTTSRVPLVCFFDCTQVRDVITSTRLCVLSNDAIVPTWFNCPSPVEWLLARGC